jgi:hypothetical protein
MHQLHMSVCGVLTAQLLPLVLPVLCTSFQQLAFIPVCAAVLEAIFWHKV